MSLEDRVLGLIERGITSPVTIAECVGVSKVQARNAINRLTGKGMARKDGRKLHASRGFALQEVWRGNVGVRVVED